MSSRRVRDGIRHRIREVVRARIVLMAADGLRNDEIAARLDTPRQVVSKWRKRFYEQRLGRAR
jgi:transposase